MSVEKSEIEILSVNKLIKLTGWGRDRCYGLMRSKSFPSFQLGHSYYVEKKKFLEWLDTSIGKCIEV